MINCLRALIRREQKLTKADFKEWKSFSSARQVIIQRKLRTSEPAGRRSQEMPFLVPRAQRAAGEVLGFVPSLAPSQCHAGHPTRCSRQAPCPCQRELFPGRGPCERTRPGDGQWVVGWWVPGSSKRRCPMCLCSRASPEAVGQREDPSCNCDLGKGNPALQGTGKANYTLFPKETVLIPRRN